MSSRPTLIEDERFFHEYNRLASVLLAHFWDLEGQSDAEFTQAYVERTDRELLESLLSDGQRFLCQRELPMELISTNANRYLVTEAEQRQWLQTLLDRVQAELEVRRGAQGAQARR